MTYAVLLTHLIAVAALLFRFRTANTGKSDAALPADRVGQEVGEHDVDEARLVRGPILDPAPRWHG
ncbi:hypothetical protein MAPG_11749 [Magnaporthiopsis poae ATCC 64411]|uniref:Uncharacterized protein n=1 Tax=Magnaporthiopsis poae (strain ATCC 64411 / 73-15) TaxID=644358 RepID=A0A0C4EG33_MAGP6|nr:hypothetical protein MAPG_11749 [Magnaporthiopsis poae ATCC 64411]